MGPFPGSDGHDDPWLIDELVPGLAAHGDDVGVGCEDAVRQPIVTHELPDVLDRVQFRGARRQGQQGDIVGKDQFLCGVPPGLIDDDHGMGTGRDLGRDFVDVPLHSLGVAAGQNQGGADTACGADGAEDIDRLGSLVARCPGTASAFCPASRDLVLLPDPGFVLPPQLYFGAGRERGADCRQLGTEGFLKRSIANSF